MIIKCIVFIIASIFEWHSPPETGKQTAEATELDCGAPSNETFFIYRDFTNGSSGTTAKPENRPAENRKTKQ